jgi:hypothetical protein
MKRINIDKAFVEMMQLLETADEAHAMKRLTIRVQGLKYSRFVGQECTAQIRPGTRACDVLHSLKLGRLVDFYVLQSAADPLKRFPDAEEMYSKVEDGDTLIALEIGEAARLIYEYLEGKSPLRETAK